MNTDKLLLKIQRLTELELSELMEGIRGHCFKNKMNHLVEDDNKNVIESLELELEDVRIERDNLQRRLDSYKQKITEAIENVLW